ncbi:MAG: glycosyltransferase family 4 protein, partial [Candidatus Baltobacteraceae bacterium]
MNVAIATHFYLPEPCAAATRVASLADALANAGHDVTVVTNFPSFPSGTFARGDRFTLARSTRTGRTRVVRLFSVLAKGLPGFRLLHWLSSALAATCFFLFTREHFDVVIVSMPPITLAAPAFAGARRHRARLVLDVRDVFPDIAIAMGAWRRDGSMARACEWVARRLYRRADLIVAVTPTALAHIASRGVDASRLVLARNAAELAPALAGERFPNTRFTAIYAGNLGVATDLDVLVDAAVLLADDAITIEIVGDGARRAYLEERIRNENVGNIVVEGSLPRAEAMRRVASADVSIIPLRKGI